MKIILTGATGFIGQNLLPTLVIDQKIQKILLITRNRDKLPKKYLVNSKIKILELDLVREQITLTSSYDYLIHLASNIPNPQDVQNFADNIKITENIVNNIILKSKIKKIIYTSTLDVYGAPLYLPVDESHPTNPLTFYGISKLANELIFKKASTSMGINLIILRLSQVYGPSEPMVKVIPLFIEKLKNNQEIILNNNGNTVRDWVYIKDVVKIIHKSLYLNANGIFNIATGVGYSLKGLLDILSQGFSKKIKVKLLEQSNELRPKIVLDVAKAQRILGYNPLYTLEKGIKDYIK